MYALQQYEDAIKLYKAGKPVGFDELACPPGKLPLLCCMRFLVCYLVAVIQIGVKLVSVFCLWLLIVR